MLPDDQGKQCSDESSSTKNKLITPKNAFTRNKELLNDLFDKNSDGRWYTAYLIRPQK